MHINNQLDYYKYCFNELNKNMLFFDLVDSKVKEIIQKPYIVFNHMNDQESISRWLFVIKNYISSIFYQTIKINNLDIINLSELLFYANKIDEQNILNINYKNFIFIANKFKNLIVYNNRINLKLNDIFSDKNINLGHLVKDIKNNTEINFYQEKNNDKYKYMMKYLKYKGKYLNNN